MNSRFIIDKHKRIRQNHDKKSKTRKITTIKPPKIWSPTIFKPKLTDKTLYYTVGPQKIVEIQKIEAMLKEAYGFDVKVYPNVFNCFDVLLGEKTTWRKVQEVTLKVVEEYE